MAVHAELEGRGVPKGNLSNPAGSARAQGRRGSKVLGVREPISHRRKDLQATPFFMELAPLIGKRRKAVAGPGTSHSLLEGS